MQVQLAMASAQVILGLAPSLISSMSPTVGEISMLSANRPILSFMLTLGSPSVYPVRSLEYDDPLAVLKQKKRGLFRPRRILDPKKWHAWISAIEYFMVVAAIVDVLVMDGRLGFNTVSVWKVGAPYLVYLWTIFAVVPHALSAFAFYFSDSVKAERKANRHQRDREDAAGWFMARFKREVTICAAKSRRGYSKHKVDDEPFWVIAMNLSASFVSFLVLLYGTILFPSLLFIGPLDAFAVIVRYFAATLVCRLVLSYELSGIKAVEKEETGQGDGSGQDNRPLLQQSRTESWRSDWTRSSAEMQIAPVHKLGRELGPIEAPVV